MRSTVSAASKCRLGVCYKQVLPTAIHPGVGIPLFPARGCAFPSIGRPPQGRTHTVSWGHLLKTRVYYSSLQEPPRYRGHSLA